MKIYEFEKPVELTEQQDDAIIRTYEVAWRHMGTFRGMHYEQGVADALEWILNQKENPLTELFEEPR